MATTTYDFSNAIRSVQTQMDMLIVKYPTLLSRIRVGAPATSTKEEWMHDSLTPQSTDIVSFDTSNTTTATGINFTSTAGMRAGQLLRFTSTADVSREEIVQIVSVDSATDTTVTRAFGGSTATALVTGDLVFNVSKPVAQGTAVVTPRTAAEGTVEYNYTQIFEDTISLARTAIQTNQYGNANTMAYQMSRILIEKMMELNSSIIYGRRYVGTSSAPATMAGILQYLAGGNIDTTGSAISKTIINNMIAAIWADGAMASNFLLVCAENQARKISAFNTSGTNPVVFTSPDSKVTGGYISQFVGDLPIKSGFTCEILVEPNFPKDKIAILDLNSIELAYLQPFGTRDATPQGADYVAQRVLGEVTLRVKNGTKSHALATGLSV